MSPTRKTQHNDHHDLVGRVVSGLTIPAPIWEAHRTCEVCRAKDRSGDNLISEVLAFGRLWDGEQNAVSKAIGYAEHRSRSHRAVIRVYDDANNFVETHEHVSDFKEPSRAQL